MSFSQTDICNLALIDIGANTISSIDDGTAEADACKAIYNLTQKFLIAEHKWNFAKKWVALAELSSYTFIDDEYDYAYQLPADYVRFSRMEIKSSPYEIREQTLVTNVEDCVIEYIYLVTDTTKYPAFFLDAFASRLKISLAMKLPNTANKAVKWMELYLVAINKAKMEDAQNTNPSEATKGNHITTNDSWLDLRNS